MLAPALPLLLYSLLLWPRFPATHDLIHDGWLHAVYFTLFLYGYWMGVDEGVWAEATRLRWKSLALGGVVLGGLFGLRAVGLAEARAGQQALRLLSDIYLWSTILAILGWAHLKLNRPWRWLSWANESVYPWYILHQSVLIVLIAWLLPMQLGPVAEPVLLLSGTVLGCWGITSVVRRSNWLRPLFGLRRRAPFRYRPPSPLEHPGAHTA
jgi:glucan biosynthesis protein C